MERYGHEAELVLFEEVVGLVFVQVEVVAWPEEQREP
jgi:hypothetical protein